MFPTRSMTRRSSLGSLDKNMIVKLKTRVYRLWVIVRQFVQSIVLSVRTHLRTQPNIILLGTPEYGNMGDQLIALGELAWLRDQYPGIPIRTFSQEALLQDYRFRVLRAQIRKGDVLFLQGGGNMNDKYMNIEKIRRFVIQTMPQNRIVLFPQSVSYAQTPQAQKLKADTARIYNAHPDLTILAREETSFQTAKEMFPSLRTMLVPDIATYLFRSMGPSADFPRDGIALCLRADSERYYSEQQILELQQKLSETYDVCMTDTHIRRRVLPQERLVCAQERIDAFAHKRLIVTDRFHGVIFSILSRTPCIALRSCDHKVTDGVKWFHDLPGVIYAESTADVLRLAQTAYAMGEQPRADFSAYFEQLYQKLDLDFGKE